ncbi:hypothetical protein LI019_01385 [Enterocloster bolteae]|nr:MULTISPECIES: hypothetical protein [Clostridia]MCB7087572.1 hypothetical protein [Enterocloster bolteae]
MLSECIFCNEYGERKTKLHFLNRPRCIQKSKQ